MITLASHKVIDVSSSTRFSDYAVDLFPGLPSRKAVKKAIKAGALQLNGETAETGRHLKTGDRIDWIDLPRIRRRVYPLLLAVVYEDDDLAIIHKPAGIPVSGNAFRTIDNALPYNLQMPKTEQAAVLPVHRLDAATSGILVVGKNRKAVTHLADQFAARTIVKTYHALTHGQVATQGSIYLPIDGKKSETHFLCLQRIETIQGAGLSLLEVQPKTGRTHQIRKHLKAIGHPIVGDKLYNAEGKTYLGKGLFLVATKIELQHPRSGEQQSFSIELPNKFSAMLAYQQRRVLAAKQANTKNES